ncbi:MAG TPA: OmpA family protein [Candidatus Acidoferrales bacterium]|nr:OmpA family protein [Candidatus Acidoferrales bacterium]
MKCARLLVMLVSVGSVLAQTPPTEQKEPTPLYRFTVVARSTKAINYRHRSGATKVDFRGTALLPEARGEARVESQRGAIGVEAQFDHLEPASQFGPEYLTYVLWAITPEGRSTNLGEVLLSGSKSKLSATTELQAFAMIVTAEPYFAVTQPSDAVVLENVVRKDTLGQVEEIDAKYELLKRGQYTLNVNPASIPRAAMDPKIPLELYEARNAVEIARGAGADRYAPESFDKAKQLLGQAESAQARKANKKSVAMTAREAAQTAEDARMIALKRQEQERLAKERQAAAEREARAKAEAEAEVQRRTQAEAEQRAEADLRARAEAEQHAEAERRARAEAEQRAEAERRARAEAERAAAQAQQQNAQAEAEKARREAEAAEGARLKAEQEKAALRAQILQQLNMILETRETPRGLVVNIADVLFDTGKYTLKPLARERLAKVSGIVLSHPGLKLEVEGHTDSVGSDEFNQLLSERRAATVRDYLVSQGIPMNSVVARGFGKTQPVAENDTAAGRARNRRVELIVSGEVIGIQMRGPGSSPQ